MTSTLKRVALAGLSTLCLTVICYGAMVLAQKPAQGADPAAVERIAEATVAAQPPPGFRDRQCHSASSYL
jgi:hypothetical protein